MADARVYLIRHGRVEQGSKSLMLGWTDLPLSAKGKEQMREVAQELAPAGVRTLYSSPLIRCRQSAEILAKAWGLPVRLEHDWEEINLGQWDGLAHDLIKRRFPAEYAQRGKDLAGYRPPGGESFRDLARRVLAAYERLTRDLDEPIALVGHAGVQRVLLCRLLGMPLQNQFSLVMDPGSWTCVEPASGPGIRLTAFNR